MKVTNKFLNLKQKYPQYENVWTEMKYLFRTKFDLNLILPLNILNNDKKTSIVYEIQTWIISGPGFFLDSRSRINPGWILESRSRSRIQVVQFCRSLVMIELWSVGNILKYYISRSEH
jgi:hypothetical protein